MPEPQLDVPAAARDLADALPDAIALVRTDGTIVHANGGFQMLAGRDELVGAELAGLCADPPEQIRELLRRWSGTGAARPGSLELRGSNEEGRSVRCDGARLRGTDLIVLRVRPHTRAVEPFVEVAREIETQNLRRVRERLQTYLEELRRTNQLLETSNAELERYAAAVSHDLRAPLATIGGWAELLGDPDEEEARAAREAIQRNVERMQESINGMLALARIRVETGLEDVHTDTQEAVAEALEALHAAFGDLDAAVEVGELQPVAADRRLLVHLLTNLIGNAIQYRHPERPLRISITSRRSDGDVEISVRDNGRGVPEAEMASIFEPLRRGSKTSDVPGTGIGLATCRRIVELHGGTITCEPTDGPGALFRFRLPSA